MNKWPITSLKGKINIKHGFPFKSEYFSDEATQFIVLTPGNFYEEGGFKRQAGKEKFYTGDIPEDYLHKAGDLIVAMTEQAVGLLGSCARVPESGIYLHNQRLGLVTTVSKKILKDYIYHLFKTKTVREQIRLTSSGSKVKHTSPERIYDVRVPLPTVSEQQNIVSLLDTLETKIELNNRINTELEAMAKTLYDYWFVQFDFPDDSPQGQGKPYKTSGGKMVYNPTLKREIPAGWSDGIIADVIGKVPQATKVLAKEFQDNGKVPVIDQSQSYICGFTDDETATIKPESAHVIFGDHTRAVKLVNFDYARGADGTQVLVAKSDKVPSYLLYQIVSDIDLSSYGYARHYKFLKESKCVIPRAEVSQRYQNTVNHWHEKIRDNIFQNYELERLRDWLLPMLMNGQVTVK
ncbi:restriction endonuclease subunit S [Marinomonas hwangdonensis]|uniref:Restriction endonuclease subunit S n=1 Tax=Marinomonas hwangdonensis TaxID=1053647 RepID=A0A3M8QBR7_9GAMM|nr:restriction endonuclease subunit S [Marinomonas hwangdonensis]RNF52624.1 restriction endonuclease subunit S [Marinomonas hwangdonensis]